MYNNHSVHDYKDIINTIGAKQNGRKSCRIISEIKQRRC